MKSRTILIAAAVMLMLSVQPVLAARPVGYNHLIVPANSDALMSVPFTQQAVGNYTVATVVPATGVTVGTMLTPNAFDGAYYVRFLTGSASGLWSTISTNGANNIDMSNLDVLNLVAPGDSFRVYPHHTLGSVFPKKHYGFSFVNGTKILFFENDINNMSQNKAAKKTATYSKSLGRWVGAGISNSTVLEPETQFIVRNNAAYPLKVVTRGFVPDYTVSLLVAASGDINTGSGYPVPVVLTGSGLEGNLFKVLFYDNGATGQNKAAVKTATYSSSLGRWVGAGVTGAELIKPSEAITYRLPSGVVRGTKVRITKPY